MQRCMPILSQNWRNLPKTKFSTFKKRFSFLFSPGLPHNKYSVKLISTSSLLVDWPPHSSCPGWFPRTRELPRHQRPKPHTPSPTPNQCQAEWAGHNLTARQQSACHAVSHHFLSSCWPRHWTNRFPSLCTTGPVSAFSSQTKYSPASSPSRLLGIQSCHLGGSCHPCGLH